MTAVVRIFTYSEVITAPVAASSGRFASDSIGLLKGRYLGRDMVTASTGAAVATASSAASNTNVKLVQVQVEPGKIVHYEIFPEGHSGAITEATTASPFTSGTQLFSFGPNYTISLLEASF